jgi:HK97 family phage portal protein
MIQTLGSALTDIITRAASPKISAKASELMRNAMYNLHGPVYPAYDAVNLLYHGYIRNADVFAGIDRQAKLFASVPYYLGKVNSQNEVERVRRPDLDRVLKQPNPTQTDYSLRYQMYTSFKLFGNAYEHIISPKGGLLQGRAIESWWIKTQDMRAVVDTNSATIKGYQNTTNAAGVLVPPTNMIHWKSANPDSYIYGMPPLLPALRAIILGNSGLDANVATMQNMGMYSLIMFFKDELGQEQVDNIYANFENSRAGSSHAGEPLILTGDVDRVENVSQSVRDMDWSNSMLVSKRLIAQCLGMSAKLLGDPAASTYNNLEEDKLSLIYDTVIPDADQYAQLKTQYIAQTYAPDLVYLLDYDKLEAIQKQRVETFGKLDKVNFITGNEKREQANFEKSADPAMDTIMQPSSLVPISDAGMSMMPDVGGVDEL